MSQTPSFFTVRQFSERHRAFPIGGLRYFIFHADSNGLQASGAIVRVGRKVLIDEVAFLMWVKGAEHHSVRQKLSAPARSTTEMQSSGAI